MVKEHSNACGDVMEWKVGAAIYANGCKLMT
jgi:hypothetical protein